eukprot:TRINITY_DN49563_c0_g1_i1.p1 TRINITY_DN49563_c0_g1~~TRINITY_DN49563_c0_g1_i1.p1  ORF type:complete len:347 (+),score=73.18 TRINITY_DN49563_c0_g1_i1:66-1106(+)
MRCFSGLLTLGLRRKEAPSHGKCLTDSSTEDVLSRATTATSLTACSSSSSTSLLSVPQEADETLGEVLANVQVVPLLAFCPPSACARLRQCSRAFGGGRHEQHVGLISPGMVQMMCQAYLQRGDTMSFSGSLPSGRGARQQQISLHDAAEAGDSQAVWCHLHLGTSPDAYDGHGCCALHYAAAGNRGHEASMLVKAKADLHAKHQGLNVRAGWTPLHFAAYAGARDVLALLLLKGARVNEMDVCRRTALFYAQDRRQLACGRLLRKCGGLDDLHIIEEQHLPEALRLDDGAHTSRQPNGSMIHWDASADAADMFGGNDQGGVVQMFPDGNMDDQRRWQQAMTAAAP